MLLPHMVVAIHVQGTECVPVVLLGLTPGQPVYVAGDGSWDLPYVPAMLRAYPFSVQTTPDGKRALCLQEDHLSQGEGTPLFMPDGALSDPVAETYRFLERREQAQREARASARALLDAGVLEPWPLQIQVRRGEKLPYPVSGLHRVQEAALNQLSSEAYHGLRGGPMALAHAQWFGSVQVSELARRAAGRASAEVDLSDMFDGDDELGFRFDGVH